MSKQSLLSLPEYRAPLLEPFRCPGCGRRYLLWRAEGDKERAQREASSLAATLVDVTAAPFTYCSCGSIMDLVESVSDRAM
jgi:hypothetical protein